MSHCQQPQTASSLCHLFHLRGERCHATQGSSHTSHGGRRGQPSLLLFSGVDCLSRVLNWRLLRGMALPHRARPPPGHSTLSYQHDASSRFCTIEWVIFMRIYFWAHYCASIDPCVSLSSKSHCLFFFFFLNYFVLQSSCFILWYWTFLVAQLVKNPPAMPKTWVQSLGRENPLEKG